MSLREINDDTALKYRALLQISEALIANRDRDALVRSLWDTLQPLIAFDYLVIMRYDAARHCVLLKAIAGMEIVWTRPIARNGRSKGARWRSSLIRASLSTSPTCRAKPGFAPT